MWKIGTDQYQISVLIIGQMRSHLSLPYPRIDVNQLYLRVVMPLYLIGIGGSLIEIGVFIGMTRIGGNGLKIWFIQRPVF